MRKVMNMLMVMLACLCLPVSAAAASASVIPYTGDTSAVYTWLGVMVAALLALIIAVVSFCKSKKK